MRAELSLGDGDLAIFGEPDANETRCRRCGRFLYSLVRAGRYVHVAMGSLRDDPTIRPNHHIFMGSKAPWEEIHDTTTCRSTRATTTSSSTRARAERRDEGQSRRAWVHALVSL